MKNRRSHAKRVRRHLARHRLHRNGDLVKECRREVSPVIRSLGARRRTWARNGGNLPGTARARAGPPEWRARAVVHQIVGIPRARGARDQAIKLIPIERPRGLRRHKMIAFGACRLGRSVREHQEQQNGCSPLRHRLDESYSHLRRCRMSALRAGKSAPASVDR
jgi:hypothetical protein